MMRGRGPPSARSTTPICASSFFTLIGCSTLKPAPTTASDADPAHKDTPPVPARPSARVKGRLWRLAREGFGAHVGLFAISLGLSALVAAATASYGLLVKTAFDWIEAGDTRALTLLPFAIILAASIKAISLYAQTLTSNTAVQRGLIDIQDRLFARVIGGDYAHLQGEGSGALVARFLNDMNVLREGALRVANNLARSLLTVLACAGVLIWLDWTLALMLLAIYPIAILPVVKLTNRIRKSSDQALSQTGSLTASLSELFRAGRTVKAYGLEGRANAAAHDGFATRARLVLKVLSQRAAVDPILEVMGGVGFALVLSFAGWRITTGEASVGDLIAFLTMLAAMAPEVRALGTLSGVLAEAGAAADRLFETLDRTDTVVETGHPRTLHRARGEIEISDAVFAYPGADMLALSGVSVSVAPGETVALVGPSGSGKSTLFNLLLRLYDVQAGAVRLDGVDVRELGLGALRGQFGLVSQEAFIFDDTAAANIALGRADLTPQAILEAARQADAADFLLALPEGLNTRLGEGGGTLSGGQRQRLALARALARNAPILLLDEATSALDSEAEARVQAALDQARAGRTTLVIAHRLSTVVNADRIYVLEAGKVVEVGRHADLMAKNGLYARLAAQQFQG